MNKNDEKFQKWLAIYQVCATIFVAIGAIVITIGMSQVTFGTSIPIDLSHATNSTQQELTKFSENLVKSGWQIIQLGIIISNVFPTYFMYLIAREKIKARPKFAKINEYPILFDEMYDGKDVELKKKGYDAYSVKKLRLEGEPLQYDYSVLKYVEENKMILITEDPENYGGCQENNLPCIKLGQNPSVEEIVKELESLKADYDSKKTQKSL